MNKFVIWVGSNGKTAGKTEFAKRFIENNPNKACEILNFSNPLKNMTKELLSYLGVDNINEKLYGSEKEKIIDDLYVSTRYIMQTLGTDWGRELIDDKLWVKAFNKRLNQIESDIVINDSVRFINEILYINQLKKSLTVKIKKPELEVDDNHKSEKEISDQFYDIVIINDAGITELKMAASIEFIDRIDFFKTTGAEYHVIRCSDM